MTTINQALGSIFINFTICKTMIYIKLLIKNWINRRIEQTQPIKVQASNSMLAVTGDGIKFYDLNTLQLHLKYDRKLVLSVIDSMSYGFNDKTKEMFCFNSNGNFQEKVNLTFPTDGKLVEVNKCLL